MCTPFYVPLTDVYTYARREQPVHVVSSPLRSAAASLTSPGISERAGSLAAPSTYCDWEVRPLMTPTCVCNGSGLQQCELSRHLCRSSDHSGGRPAGAPKDETGQHQHRIPLHCLSANSPTHRCLIGSSQQPNSLHLRANSLCSASRDHGCPDLATLLNHFMCSNLLKDVQSCEPSPSRPIAPDVR